MKAFWLETVNQRKGPFAGQRADAANANDLSTRALRMRTQMRAGWNSCAASRLGSPSRTSQRRVSFNWRAAVRGNRFSDHRDLRCLESVPTRGTRVTNAVVRRSDRRARASLCGRCDPSLDADAAPPDRHNRRIAPADRTTGPSVHGRTLLGTSPPRCISPGRGASICTKAQHF